MHLREQLLREWLTGLRIKSFGLVETPNTKENVTTYSGIDEKRGLCFGFGVSQIEKNKKKQYGIISVEYYKEEEHGIILLISCKFTGLSEPFSLFCQEVFDLYREDKEYQLENIENILKEWFELFGNQNKEKNYLNIVIGLIGELLFLKRVLNILNSAGNNWQGPDNSINDFRFGNNSVEIKTTTLRNARYIEAHGIHQFEVKDGEKLMLGFCRLEKVKSGGFSIEHLCSELKKFIPTNTYSEIEVLLNEIDNESKNQLFREVEFNIYYIDDMFPRLTFESFKNNKIPDHLSNFRYQINLSGLSFMSFEEWIQRDGYLFLNG